MDIKDRIRAIIEREGLTQVAFSDMTGIKPAALNHVLTGRNNASREVIDKILSAFPHYEEDWLLLGQGPVLTEQARTKIIEEKSPSLFPDYVTPSNDTSNKKGQTNDTTSAFARQDSVNSGAILMPTKKIAKIIVYYTDNTFETLLPSD